MEIFLEKFYNRCARDGGFSTYGPRYLFQRGDSVTSIFLLKNLATPTRAAALRLSTLLKYNPIIF